MQAIQWVISTIMVIAGWFYWLYVNIPFYADPLGILRNGCLWVSDSFIDLAHYFAQFGLWVSYAQDWISKILSWDYILSLIMPYIQWGINAWDWVKAAWGNVWSEIEIWWGYAKDTVLGWIDVAKQWALDLINQANTWIGSLQSAWSEFTTTILPNLANWTGIAGLIESYLRDWFPWYETLVSIKDEMFEFFADPIDYVYNKLDEFFERWW